MKLDIRLAKEMDRTKYIGFVTKLSKYSRENHCDECKTDDYDLVLENIRSKADDVFSSRDEDGKYLLMAELDNEVIGYALAGIYEEDSCADNGTGRVGFFDELFVDESARGNGVGQSLLDEVMKWFRDNDIGRIKLHAYTWNEGAIKLYERNGFKAYVSSYQCFI